ncbi:RagB/SusD family nutrient uptake outer membrane protein [Flammeovirgaceae bacterium SG7u.111]|nr:RagB/SusD family nutrient uptake outer membrane protein [Flammeovirgaceae bacterium SG7u.132]WPO33733.1 RagB/SusD family nutrient uptake outer membrane protein [Flammeovirgaceae bacterium SG7u.111]
MTSIVFSSCDSYLDIVPDNVATIDNAFKLRNEAEKYLFTCYSFLPKNGDGWYNVGMMGADEIVLPQATQGQWHAAYRISMGQQRKDDPYFNEWAGTNKGNGAGWNQLKLFAGMRHCNTFIETVEDVNNVPDLSLNERARWISEVKFLNAYYHFILLKMYGPIPIMDGLPEITEAPTSKRMPVDEVVDFISNTIDESLENLPDRIVSENTELGRITKPIALAVKARLWMYAASPLFNGNPDFSGFTDNEGTALFNPTFDATKWEKARDAAKAAIDAAEENGHMMYEYTNDIFNLNDETKTKLNIRNAITDRWSSEVVWGLSNSYFFNHNLAMPPMLGGTGTSTSRFVLGGIWAAPIKIAKMFYTENGVPIDEDKTLDFTDYTEVWTSEESDQFKITPGFETARLNFDREPRFYADLGFDGGTWYMKDGNETGSDIDNYYIECKNAKPAGYGHFTNWNETGYFIKKLVHWESSTSGSTDPSWTTYPWPEVRMADLYLMYAEALNEVEPGSTQAIEYLDIVRERAGLKGVVESWSNFSTNPTKYSSQDGLREIIHQERLIELAFEGQRFWDLRRWKKAAEELNKDITGFNIYGKTTETYNNERVIYTQKFITPRDYLWPIGNYDIRRNPNLVENPGW